MRAKLVVMDELPVVVWVVDDDVVDAPREQKYRTIVAGSSSIPRPLSVVLCVRKAAANRHAGIVAVGQVWRHRGVTTSRVGVRVEPFWTLYDPIALDDVLQIVGDHAARALRQGAGAESMRPTQLTKPSARKTLDAVKALNEEANSLLSRFTTTSRIVEGLDGMRLREERDAFNTCLDLAGVALPPEMTPERTLPIEDGQAFGAAVESYFVTDLEDDLIADELRRFDGSAQIRRIAGSASTITDKDVRLTVINVNRKKLEHVHGVDLVYYDHITDQATVVQYKRLERTTVGDGADQKVDWLFKRKTDLVKQLALMKQPARELPNRFVDWRLSPSPSFFKFVRSEDFDPDGQTVLKGMYVPADYLALGVREGAFDTGPKGGFGIGYNNTRYLNRDVFVQLVRRGWIGTTSTDKSSLASMVAEMAKNHEVVLGLRSQVGGNTRT